MDGSMWESTVKLSPTTTGPAEAANDEDDEMRLLWPAPCIEDANAALSEWERVWSVSCMLPPSTLTRTQRCRPVPLNAAGAEQQCLTTGSRTRKSSTIWSRLGPSRGYSRIAEPKGSMLQCLLSLFNKAAEGARPVRAT